MPPLARYLLSRAIVLGLLVLAALAVRTFVAVPRGVPGASMLPTLWPGDQLVVARYAGGDASPARGDVVVVQMPGGDRIGRVIGLPGDRVAVRRGVPVLNGKALPRYRVADLVLPLSRNLRCPVAETRRGKLRECRVERFRETAPDGRAWDVLDTAATRLDERPAVTVPAGRLFLLGDNRDASADSRSAPPDGLGPVPAEAVVGRAETILWSGDGRGSWRHFWRWGETLRPARILKGVERTPADG